MITKSPLFVAFSIFYFAFCSLSCNSHAHIINNGALRNGVGQEFHWQEADFPIRIAIHPGVSDIRNEGVIVAIEKWNSLLNEEIFIIEEVSRNFPMWNENGSFGYRGYIAIEEGVAGIDPIMHTPRNGIAAVHLQRGISGHIGRIHSVHILIDNRLSDVSYIFRVAFHELGHALGLAHDVNDENSIMWFSSTANDNQRLQREDLEYVRREIVGDIE